MVLVYLLIALVVLGYIFVKKTFSHFDKFGVKYVKPNFLFGNLTDNVFKRKAFAEIIMEQYVQFKGERYNGLFQFFMPTLMLNDPELIKEVTVKNFDHFTDHAGGMKEDYDPLWTRNVFSMRGQSWHNMRSTLSPAFTGSKMRFIFPLINEVAERTVNHFLDKNIELNKLEMKNTFSRITNDSIASTSFGITCDSFQDPENEFFTNGKKAFTFTGIRKLAFFMYSSTPRLARILGIKMFPEDISAFFRRVIKETIMLREEKGLVRPDMIHLLLQARKGQLTAEEEVGNEESFSSVKEYSTKTNASMRAAVQISDEDITAQALVFFFGGFDTSSYLMTFVSYELAINPDIQKRLIVEVDAAWEACKGKITYEEIMKMKYLDMVLSETLRKWPIGLIIDRCCTKEYVIEPKRRHEKPIHLKPGDVLWCSVIGIHRDPEIYPDPEKFDPERFNAENKSKINRSIYMPFGSGPRNCLGARLALTQSKTILTNMLRKFEFVPVKETANPLVLSKEQINMTSEGGLWLGLKKRSI